MLALGEIVVLLIDLKCSFHPLKGLDGCQLWQGSECALGAETTWVGKGPEFNRIYEEIILGEASQEAFEVISALLNECHVVVAEVLLGRNGGDWNAWPHLAQHLV